MNSQYLCDPSGEKRRGALHITQKVDYGMFLLSTIASQGGESPQSLQVLAREHNLSFAFLQQVARVLRQAGLLASVRGKAGGYRITKPAEEISVREVIEALEGPIKIMECISEGTPHACPRAAWCTMRTQMHKLNDEIKSLLHDKTIAHFISSHS